MAIAGATFVAGPYTVTWAGLSLGIMIGDDQVPTIEQINKARPIDKTDQYGDMMIDAITMGADYFAQMTCAEILPGVRAALNPFGGSVGSQGQAGRLYTNLAAPLILTAVAGTTAASSGPASITAAHAILVPNWTAKVLMGPQHRTVPLRFILLPSIISGSPTSYVAA